MLVGKHLVIDGLQAKLIVVLAPLEHSTRVDKVEADISKLADDYPDAEYLTSSAIPKFAERVLAEAK